MNSEVDDGNTPVRRTSRARKVNTRFVGADIDEEYIKLVGRITASNYSELKPEIKEHRLSSIEGCSDPDLNDNQEVNSNDAEGLKLSNNCNKYITVNVNNFTDGNQHSNSVIKLKKVKRTKVNKDVPCLAAGEIRPSVIVQYRSSTESEASDISLGADKKRKCDLENILEESDSLKRKCDEYDVESRLAEVLNMKPFHNDTKNDEPKLCNSTLKQTMESTDTNPFEESVKLKDFNTKKLDGNHHRAEFNSLSSNTKLEQNPAKVIVTSKNDMNLGLPGKKLKIVSLKIPADLQHSNQSFNNNQIVISNLKTLELKVVKKDSGGSGKNRLEIGSKLPSVPELTPKISSKKVKKDISPSNFFSSDGEDDIPLTKLISKNAIKKAKNCSKNAFKKTKKLISKNKISFDKRPVTGLKIKKIKKLPKSSETKHQKNETSQDDLPLQLLKDTFAKVKKVKLSSNVKSISTAQNDERISKKLKKAKKNLKLKMKSDSNEEQVLKKLNKPETSLIKKKTSLSVPNHEIPKIPKKKTMKFRMKFPSLNKKSTNCNDLTNIVVSVGEKEDDYACVTVDKSKVTPKFDSHSTSLPDEPQKKYTFVQECIVPGIYQGLVLESDISEPAPKKSKITKKFKDCIAELDAKAQQVDNKEKNKKSSKVLIHSNNLMTSDAATKLSSIGTSAEELTNENSTKSGITQSKPTLEYCERLLNSSERSQTPSEDIKNSKKGKDVCDADVKFNCSPSPKETKYKLDVGAEKRVDKKSETFSVEMGKKDKSSERHKERRKSAKLESVERTSSKELSEDNVKLEISKNINSCSKSYEVDKGFVTKEKASPNRESSDKKKCRSHDSEKRALDVSSDAKLLKSVKSEDKHEKNRSRVEREERKHSKSSKEGRGSCNTTLNKKDDIDIKSSIKEGASKDNTPKKIDCPLDIKTEEEFKSSGTKKENLLDKNKTSSGTGMKHPFELSIMFDEKEYTSKKKNKHHSRHRSKDEQISPQKSDSCYENENKTKSKYSDTKDETIGIASCSSDNKRLKSHHDHKSRSHHSNSSSRKKYERDKHSEKSKYREQKDLKNVANETNINNTVIKCDNNELISPKGIKLTEPLGTSNRIDIKSEKENSYNNSCSAIKSCLERTKQEESSANQKYDLAEKSQNAIHHISKSKIVDEILLSDDSCLEISKEAKEINKPHLAILSLNNHEDSKCMGIKKDAEIVKMSSHVEEKSLTEEVLEKNVEMEIEKTVAKLEDNVVKTIKDFAITNKKQIKEITNGKDKAVSMLIDNTTSDYDSLVITKSAKKEHSKIKVLAEEESSKSDLKMTNSKTSRNLSNKIENLKIPLKASQKDIQKQMGKEKYFSNAKTNEPIVAKKKNNFNQKEKRVKADFKISTNSFFRNKTSENVSDEVCCSRVKNEYENNLHSKNEMEIAGCKLKKEPVKYSTSMLEIQASENCFKTSTNDFYSSTDEDVDNLKDPNSKMQSSSSNKRDLSKYSNTDIDKPIVVSSNKYEKQERKQILKEPPVQIICDESNNKENLEYQQYNSFDERTQLECSSKVICSYISTRAAAKEPNFETDKVKSYLKQESVSDKYNNETDISSTCLTEEKFPFELQNDKSKVDKPIETEKAVAAKSKKVMVPSMHEYICKSVFPSCKPKVSVRRTFSDKKHEVKESSASLTNQTIFNNLSTIPLPGENSKSSTRKIDSLSTEMIQEDNAPFMDFLSAAPERKMEITHSLENKLHSSPVDNKGNQSPLHEQLDSSTNAELESLNSNCDSKVGENIIDSIIETNLTEPLETASKARELTAEERLEMEKKNKEVVENRMKGFEHLEENLYLVGKVKSQSYKGDRRMICDCTLSKEEIENNETGCGEDCLNKLLMIECGSRCALNERCMNKNFQHRNYANVEVFNAEEKGCGIRACTDIAPGTFIMEYIGEVFNTKEFKRRRKEYGKTSSAHFYFMALNQDRFIDATLKGNISRFINHSCSPNAETQKWTVNGDLRIGFFATTHIYANEEINFDYRLERYGREPQKCYCGTPVCRGWLGESPDEKTKEEKEEDRRKELRNKKKRELRSYFGDVDLEYEIEKLNLRGLRNRQDTLNLSRLMVRALESDTRMRLLKMLETGEEACKRLFLDYHGLKLLWSWMADISSSSKNDPLKLYILKTLSSLPITNKTQLTESRVLDVVERWSKELNKIPFEVNDDKEKLVDSMKQASSSCDKNELSEDSDTDTPDSKDPSPSDTTSPDDSSLDSSETPINSQADQIMTDLSSQVGSDIINLDDDNSSSSSPQDSDLANGLSVSEMAMKLLPTWDNLKEVFKIPRKERLQIMKEHEREVDQEFKKYLNKNKKSDEDRTQAFYDRWRYGVDKDKDKSRKKDSKSDKKRGKKDKEDEDKNISKEERRERRERFAMQVAKEDEAARQKKLQEDMWTLHLQRCILLGQDPNFTPIFDPTGQFYWDPNSGSWQPYIGPVGNLPVPASYGPNPGLMGSLCLNTSINQLFNSGSFYPLPHAPVIDCEGGIKGQGARDEELELRGSPSTLDPPLTIESLKDFQKAARDDSLTSAGILSMTIILPSKWKMASDTFGHLYFYHTKTRYSQWDIPTPDLHEKLMAQYTLTSDSESDTDSDSVSSSNSEEFSSDEDDTEKEVKEEVLEKTTPRVDEKMVKRVKGQRRHSEKLVQARVISPILFEDREAARKERKEAKEKARVEARKERWSSYKNSRNDSKENNDSFESYDPVDNVNDYEEDFSDSFMLFGKSSKKSKQNSDGKQNTKGKSKERMATALADNSENARKIKESFKTCMATFIVSVLNPYLRQDCTEGHISSKEDFKYLSRKLTHFVMLKELKQLPNVEKLDCSESVKHKTKEFVRKYMAKYGSTFQRDPNDTKDYGTINF